MPVVVNINESGDFVFSGRSFKITEDKNKALAPYGKQLHCFGVELALLPSEAQESILRKTIGCARFARNHYLKTRMDYYANKKKTLSVAMYKKELLPLLKKEHPFLCEVDKFAIESAIEHVEIAFKNFFSHNAKFPRFVSKYKPNGNKYTTKYTGNNIRLHYHNKKACLKLPKVGSVPFVLPKHRNLEDVQPFNARITSVSVRLDNDRFYASIQMEEIIPLIVPKFSGDLSAVIGADMGIKNFCIYGTDDESNIEEVPNPRWIKVHAKRIRRLQQSLARKQYDQKTHTGSKNREKVKAKLAKEHRKIKNQRKDFHHKLSRKIADRCEVFTCESLNIKGMLKNRHLSKAISSVGWGQFLRYIKYKVEQKGGFFVQVDRFFPSSKTCSCCGYKYQDLTLDKREWTCPSCGSDHDRDHNAVHNIIHEGLRVLNESA